MHLRAPEIASWVALLVLVAALLMPAAVRAEYVIGPGQEDAIGRMIGVGTLPGPCQLDRGNVSRESVEAHYRCEGREALLELRHPDQAPEHAVRTRSFAIVPGPGAPDTLVDLIRSRVLDAESAFHWTQANPESALPSQEGPASNDDRAVARAPMVQAVLHSPAFRLGVLLAAVAGSLLGLRRLAPRIAKATAPLRRSTTLFLRRMSASSGGNTIALFAPHIVLGTWLRLVPDGRAFRINQAVVLVHVVAALGSIPLFALAFRRHARNGLDDGAGAAATVTRVVLAFSAAAAFATGIAALWSGDIGGIGRVHAFCGIFPALPLGVHLLQEGRRALSVAGVALILVTPLSVIRLENLVRVSEAAVAVDGAPLELVDARLYDTADWCGGCHTEQYAEWSRSTHASAMFRPRFRQNLAHTIAERGAPIADTNLLMARGSEDVCVKCHSPKTYYDDDERPALDVEDGERNGVGCSFCHTVAGLERAGDRNYNYVSAPDSVRRYLFQNSSNRLLSTVGDLLIRWRPGVHRQDYHRPFMDTGEVCRGCHVDAFDQWQRTPFSAGVQPIATGGDTTRRPTQCQDCHMALVPTGGPLRDPGRLVPWGPVRPQRRNHWFRGGNVAAALDDGDLEFGTLERDARRGALAMRVLDVRRDTDGVTASVAIRGERVGHLFLTGEGVERHAWLALSALDADGREIAASGTPSLRREGPRLPPDVTSLPIGEHGGKPADYATTNAVLPGEERRYEVHLRLGDIAPASAHVEIALRNNFDPEPLLRTSVPLPSF